MNDTKLPAIDRNIAISLYLTGLFAAVGALYSWGDGLLWALPPDAHTSIYLADLLLAAPVSLAAAYGVHKRKSWAQTASVLAAGIFLYGSFLVYAGMALAPETFSWRLLLPPVFGIGLSAVILRRAVGRTTNPVDLMSYWQARSPEGAGESGDQPGRLPTGPRFVGKI